MKNGKLGYFQTTAKAPRIAKFKSGRNIVAGAFFLKRAAIINGTGYVRTVQKKMYAPALGPASNAIADSGTNTIHGTIRISQNMNSAL